MKATNLEHLKKLVEDNPDEYPSSFLDEGSFAYHCYDKNAYNDLDIKLKAGQVNEDECRKFDITEAQWTEAMEMAKFVHYQEMLQIGIIDKY